MGLPLEKKTDTGLAFIFIIFVSALFFARRVRLFNSLHPAIISEKEQVAKNYSAGLRLYLSVRMSLIPFSSYFSELDLTT